MKLFRHIIFKRSIAFLLIGLLAFVHAEKAIHHHEKIIVNEHKAGISSVSNNPTCSICDYVFAKDMDVPVLCLVSSGIHYSNEKIVSFLSLYNKLVVFHSNDRGPPAC